MRYINKIWLSKDYDETGTMVVKSESPRTKDMHEYSANSPAVDAEVIFRDCYNSPITLSFNVGSESSLQRRLDKIQTMIEALENFKGVLQEQWNDVNVQAQAWLEANPEELRPPKPPRRSIVDMLSEDK